MLALLTIPRSRRTYLDIVFRELLSQRPSTSRQGVDSVVYRDLAILVVQEMIDILAAFSHNLLPQEYR